MQFVPLILEYLSQVHGDFARHLLDKSIQLSQIIGQTYQLIESSDLEIGYVKLEIVGQGILLGRQVVHGVECLLAGLVTRC